eukprot:m.110302 g.110302  ORF g.110302 m.110302 type:complete len:333 (-) comp28027_c0_seq2:897-1895(-)
MAKSKHHKTAVKSQKPTQNAANRATATKADNRKRTAVANKKWASNTGWSVNPLVSKTQCKKRKNTKENTAKAKEPNHCDGETDIRGNTNEPVPHHKPVVSSTRSQSNTVDQVYSPAQVRWWTGAPRIGQRSRAILEHLFGIPITEFQSEYWLKKPWIRHLSDEQRKDALHDPSHPMNMLRMIDVEHLLRRDGARYLNDVDVVRWVEDTRESLVDGHPVVDPEAVLKAFRKDGWSVRLVHPQQWHQPLYELCGVLQEYFGFTVGCSSYLTPKSTQGFGPHYDDVEIFVVQLQGEKRWRLYNRPDKLTSPRTTKEYYHQSWGTLWRSLCCAQVT